jgi:ankyrin repeat protein
VSRDHRFILACLLKHSPDLSTRSPQGETALHVAARLGLVEITEQLLAHKKSIDAFSKDDIEGNNVLHLAALNGSERVCRLLVNAYAQYCQSQTAIANY